MTPDNLAPFVDAAKTQGAGDEFLAALLTRRGWPANDVYAALGSWWERSTGIVIPRRRGSAENARDAFLYLLAFATLAVWSGSLGSLWFNLIEHWLPDPVVTRYAFNLRDSVTWQSAAILVGLPIYLLVMRLIVRETASDADRIESGVRKWLTYIALLLAATGLVSDLVCFTSYFLRGEISLRFALKCLTVAGICGSIFAYYLGFLKGRGYGRVFAALAAGCAITGVSFGLGWVGGPTRQREIEADMRRVENLRTIGMALQTAETLPPALADLRRTHPDLRITDPQTAKPYDYRVLGGHSYELCADFAAPSSAQDAPSAYPFWSHNAGHACFRLDSTRPVTW